MDAEIGQSLNLTCGLYLQRTEIANTSAIGLRCGDTSLDGSVLADVTLVIADDSLWRNEEPLLFVLTGVDKAVAANGYGGHAQETIDIVETREDEVVKRLNAVLSKNHFLVGEVYGRNTLLSVLLEDEEDEFVAILEIGVVVHYGICQLSNRRCGSGIENTERDVADTIGCRDGG